MIVIACEFEVTTGSEETTLIKYPVPAAVPAGMLQEMPVAEPDPMLIGEANEPAEEDNCTVKVFPTLNEPVVLKSADRLADNEVGETQKGVPAIGSSVTLTPAAVVWLILVAEA